MLTSRTVLRAFALVSTLVVSGEAFAQATAARQPSTTQLPPATYKRRLSGLHGLSHVTVEVETCKHDQMS